MTSTFGGSISRLKNPTGLMAEHGTANWRAARCRAEHPCATKNEAHLILYGECFFLEPVGRPVAGYEFRRAQKGR